MKPIDEWECYPKKLSWKQKLEFHFDFTSIIKSVWLTGYFLITWQWCDVDKKIINFEWKFYPNGAFGD